MNLPFFRLAKHEASKVDFWCRVGAVLVRRGKPIAVGRNRPTKTSTLYRKYHPEKTIHAEVDCVLGVERQLIQGSDMYVYRINNDGEVRMAKPCVSCLAMLLDLGISRVTFSANGGVETMKVRR